MITITDTNIGLDSSLCGLCSWIHRKTLPFTETMGSCPCFFSPPQSSVTALLCLGLTDDSNTSPHLFSLLSALPPSLQEDTCFKSRPGVKSSVLSQAPVVYDLAHAPGQSELPEQRKGYSFLSVTVFQPYHHCSYGCFESLWFVSDASWCHSRPSDLH